jgi:hypothetical protein
MVQKQTPRDPKTDELWSLMREHQLSTRKVGELVARSRQCVKRWTSEKTIISQPMLDLLKYRLSDKPKPTK